MSEIETSGRSNEQKCGCVSYYVAPTVAFLIELSPSFIPQARIALLEGERRSFDNVKLDLMRRIKMLEYALRVERYVLKLFHSLFLNILTCHIRTKQLNQSSSQAVPPMKLAAIQSQMGGSSQKDEGSSGSSPRSEGT
jgi:striatin 1/3/4